MLQMFVVHVFQVFISFHNLNLFEKVIVYFINSYYLHNFLKAIYNYFNEQRLNLIILYSNLLD